MPAHAGPSSPTRRPAGLFEIDGVRVHVHIAGEGPPVGILLNGNGSMVQDWLVSGLFDRLRRAYRVIAIDRPGYGHTERRRDRVWTPYAQAELVRRTLAHLGVEKPIVLGHSLGHDRRAGARARAPRDGPRPRAPVRLLLPDGAARRVGLRPAGHPDPWRRHALHGIAAACTAHGPEDHPEAVRADPRCRRASRGSFPLDLSCSGPRSSRRAPRTAP